MSDMDALNDKSDHSDHHEDITDDDCDSSYGMGYDLERWRFEMMALWHELSQERKERSQQYNKLQNEVDLLKKENLKLKDALDFQESKNRKNNILIFGVSEHDTSTTPENTINEICKNLEVKIGPTDISDAYRVGRNKGCRPILCKVATFQKKSEILNKNKKVGQYAILHDLTKKERHDKKRLKSRLDDARSRGLKAFIRNGMLIINNMTFTEAEYDEHIGNTAGGGPDMQQPRSSRRSSPPRAAQRENHSPPSPRPPDGHLEPPDGKEVVAQPSPRHQRAAARNSEEAARVVKPPPPPQHAAAARRVQRQPATQAAERRRASCARDLGKKPPQPPPPRQILSAVKGSGPLTRSTAGKFNPPWL